MALSRRSFTKTIGALAAALGAGARRLAAQARSPNEQTPTGLDAMLVMALAEAVLPSDLGRDGCARVGRDFVRWAISHKQGAELLHPYGSAAISHTTALPLAHWNRQLRELDSAAREATRSSFAALGIPARAGLVRNALGGERISGLPSAAAAQHVAIALISRFYSSPEATDLCYQVRIGREQCRPLSTVSHAPAPTYARRGASTR
ncbi:MAG: hypothetical protein ACT4OZ_09265 [Gemmatimonadota bacterium]